MTRRHAQKPQPRRRHGVEAAGAGFLPGEPVYVAVTVQAETADPTGRATARIDHPTTPNHTGGVLLFGAVSGTLHLTEPS